MELTPELRLVEDALIERFEEADDWEKGDKDTVWMIVQDLRTKLDMPGFASAITDPNEGMEEDDIEPSIDDDDDGDDETSFIGDPD